MSHKDKEGQILEVKENYHNYLSDVMHFLNINARKTSTYKYVIFKSILDNLFNVNENLELPFSLLENDFSIIYWNVTAKYKLPQYQNTKGRQSKMENAVYKYIEEDNLLDEIDFYSLKDDIQEKYLNYTKNIIGIDVVHRLYSDLNCMIYGFNIKEKKIWFNEYSYRFLLEYKSTLEKLNYYAWILWIENALKIRQETSSNLASKLDLSNKRKSLDRFKEELKTKGDTEKCFYCGNDVKSQSCHLDHFVPWSFVHDDKIWNLVYSCSNCNESKNNKIPSEEFLLKIKRRNEMLLDNSYEEELDRLYKSALHNGFIYWR